MATEFRKLTSPGEWTNFFIESGIPVDVASAYAMIFYENRIQKNMLLDLNKEYLQDMGISVMGDVIAILKYAKIIHKKYMRECVLAEKNEMALSNQQIMANKNKSKGVESAEFTIMLADEVKTPQVENADSKPIKPKMLADNMNAQKFGKLQEKEVEIFFPKIKRLLPENEKIFQSHISGKLLEEPKKILDQCVKKKEIKTVFDRLGESSVSSTSDISSGSAVLTSSTSVFSRLGEKTSSIVSSTSPLENANNRAPLRATMRADDEQKKSALFHSGKTEVDSVKKRLGLTKRERQKGDDHSLETKTGSKGTEQTVEEANIRDRLHAREPSKEFVKAVASSKRISNIRCSKRDDDTANFNPESEYNSSKRVRFGSATLKLIPSFERTKDGVGSTCESYQPSPAAKRRHTKTGAWSPPVRFEGGLAGSRPTGKRPAPRSLQERLGKRRPSAYDPCEGTPFTIRDRLG